ncbi:MAG: lipid II flippase MurJ [Planctomycetota bacterium]
MSDTPPPDAPPPPPEAEPTAASAAAIPPPRRQRTLGERIFRAGMLVIGAHIIIKILSFILNVYLAHKYGIGWENDTYNLVYGGILSAIFLTGEEALGPALLATFMALKDGAHENSAAVERMGAEAADTGSSPEAVRQREFNAWGLARTVLTLHGLVILGVLLLCALDPEFVVRLWLTSPDPSAVAGKTDPQALLAPAAQMLRIAAGGLIGWSLGSITYILLNTYKIFFWAALGDAMLKVGVIFAAMTLSHALGFQALGVGVAIGGTLKLALHLWGLRKIVLRTPSQWNPARPSFPKIDFSSPGFKEFCWLLLPVAIGILLGKVRDRFYVAPLTLHNNGVLTAQAYGKGLFETIKFLIPYALSIAMYPYFCDMVDRGDRSAVGEYLTKSTRMVIACFSAMAVAIFFLAEPASALFFYNKASQANRIAWIGLSFWLNTFALPAAAVETFQMQAYFSNRKLVHAQVIGVSFSTLAITLVILLTSGASARWIWSLAGLTPSDPVALIAGVSLAFVIVRTLKVVVLGVVLKRHLPVYPWREMAFFFLRLLVMIGLAAAGIYGVVRLVGHLVPQFAAARDMAHLAKPQLFSRLHLGIGLALSSLGALAVILLAALITGMTEFRDAWQFALLRVRDFRNRRRGGGRDENGRPNEAQDDGDAADRDGASSGPPEDPPSPR